MINQLKGAFEFFNPNEFTIRLQYVPTCNTAFRQVTSIATSYELKSM